MRLASASRWRRATRSCSVSEAGGLRRAEKGSPSAPTLLIEGGLEVEIMVGETARRGERGGLGGARRRGRREEGLVGVGERGEEREEEEMDL